MRLTFDLDLHLLIGTAALRDEISAITAQRGDGENVDVQLVRGGLPVQLAGSPEFAFILKETAKFDGATLASCTSFSWDADRQLYTGQVNYATTALNTLLGVNGSDADDETSLDLNAQFAYRLSSSDAWQRSQIVTCTLFNNVWRGSESPPDLADESYIVYLSSVVGLTGGGATKLDGKATVDLAAGYSVALVDDGDAAVPIRIYELVAGTDAESAPDVIRPDDYASSTNEKVWKLRNPGAGGSGGTWGSITGTLADQTDLQSALDAKLSASSNLDAQKVNTNLPTGLYYTPDAETLDEHISAISDSLINIAASLDEKLDVVDLAADVSGILPVVFGGTGSNSLPSVSNYTPASATLAGHLSGIDSALAAAGGIGGSTGATDNAILRADGTGGATAQGSTVTVSDAGRITCVDLVTSYGSWSGAGIGVTAGFIYNGVGLAAGRTNGLLLALNSSIQFSTGSYLSGTMDLVLERAAAATLQLGANHATTPTAQTIKAHDVTTGTGASLTLAGGAGSVAKGAVILDGGNRSAYIASPSTTEIRDILISHGLMAAA